MLETPWMTQIQNIKFYCPHSAYRSSSSGQDGWTQDCPLSLSFMYVCWWVSVLSDWHSVYRPGASLSSHSISDSFLRHCPRNQTSSAPHSLVRLNLCAKLINKTATKKLSPSKSINRNYTLLSWIMCECFVEGSRAGARANFLVVTVIIVTRWHPECGATAWDATLATVPM